MLCAQCLDLIDFPDANFCNRCGRNLASSRSQTPNLARIAELVPRLKEMHSWLDQRRREAAEIGCPAIADLLDRRLAFVARVGRRLEEHLRTARQRLSHGR